MRTSNKILIGVFIAILLTLTSIYGAVYVKYTNNEFITQKQLHTERFDTYPLTGVEQVSLTGLDNVTIIPSDTARVEIEKYGDRKLAQSFTNGIFTIKGDTTIVFDGSTSRERSYREVIIYLPVVQNLKADECHITLAGAIDTSKVVTVRLAIEATDLQIGTSLDRSMVGTGNFASVIVSHAKGGTINITNGTTVKNVEATLETSVFSDGNAAIDSLTIAADDNSTISITGKNIARTKLISKP